MKYNHLLAIFFCSISYANNENNFSNSNQTTKIDNELLLLQSKINDLKSQNPGKEKLIENQYNYWLENIYDKCFQDNCSLAIYALNTKLMYFERCYALTNGYSNDPTAYESCGPFPANSRLIYTLNKNKLELFKRRDTSTQPIFSYTINESNLLGIESTHAFVASIPNQFGVESKEDKNIFITIYSFKDNEIKKLSHKIPFFKTSSIGNELDCNKKNKTEMTYTFLPKINIENSNEIIQITRVTIETNQKRSIENKCLQQKTLKSSIETESFNL